MTKDSLKKLAGALWLVMGGVLIYRGSLMIHGVWTKAPDCVKGIEEPASPTQLIIYVIVGLLVGGAKGKFVLSKSAQRNIDRIDRLEGTVSLLQIFSVKFYPLILVMIGFGFGARKLAEFNDSAWNSWFSFAACGALYVGIGAALLTSSLVYFKKKIESN